LALYLFLALFHAIQNIEIDTTLDGVIQRRWPGRMFPAGFLAGSAEPLFSSARNNLIC
jgi:hypothetical protein